MRCKAWQTLFPSQHKTFMASHLVFYFPATVALWARFQHFLPNTLLCQALGGPQSIKHFQSWFLIHSGKLRRLKEMNTQRYSIHLLLAVLTYLFKQLLVSAFGSWKRQVGISQPEYLSHTGKWLLLLFFWAYFSSDFQMASYITQLHC